MTNDALHTLLPIAGRLEERVRAVSSSVWPVSGRGSPPRPSHTTRAIFEAVFWASFWKSSVGMATTRPLRDDCESLA